jgi:predicted extracellular nuclease
MWTLVRTGILSTALVLLSASTQTPSVKHLASTAACALPYTPIYQIQGPGPTAAITGSLATRGVVVGDYEGPSPALRGFYLQDPEGDENPATSDGIFVFNGDRNSVALGDLVRVEGRAEEFEGQTQISATAVSRCGTGTVSPVEVKVPFASRDYLERYEGMLVRLPQTLYVTEHFQLGRFGQVTLSSGGRLMQPTNITTPGAAANALQAQNDLNRIVLDDSLQNQNPDPIVFGRGGEPLSANNTLRGGDTATGIVGVLTYTWAGHQASGNAYRVRPIGALNGSAHFVAANPRPAARAKPDGVLRVVGFNLLNFFTTFDGAGGSPPFACSLGVGGPPTNCRGADDAAEFARQWPKTIAAILALNPDVLGLQELANDGYGPGSAIATLVRKLNDATAPGQYAFIDVNAATGQLNALGSDAIKVGLIYQPGRVTPIGRTAVLNTPVFINAGDGVPRNRASLAQAFQQNSNGARLIVNVNHLKSKASPCDLPDQGDGQGHCSTVRTIAARQLAVWLATNPTGTADPDILLIGDYNAYAQEDPITSLEQAGYVNLLKTHLGQAYTFAFSGQWGALDHALASASLSPQVLRVAVYHINADEPRVLDYNVNFKSSGQLASLYQPDKFRSSDHDPVVVDLKLVAAGAGRFGPTDIVSAFNSAATGQSAPRR